MTIKGTTAVIVNMSDLLPIPTDHKERFGACGSLELLRDEYTNHLTDSGLVSLLRYDENAYTYLPAEFYIRNFEEFLKDILYDIYGEYEVEEKFEDHEFYKIYVEFLKFEKNVITNNDGSGVVLINFDI